MIRWLLNNFTTWQLMILIVGGCSTLAAGGQWLVARRFPELRGGEHNQLGGTMMMVLVGMYGIVLAFVIFALYTDFSSAEANVHDEATELAQLHRDSKVFPTAVHEEIGATIASYIHTLDDEWVAMKSGEDNPESWAEVDELYAEYQAFEPKGASEQAFYSEAVGRLNDFVKARRERIEDAEHSLPGELMMLIFVGAGLVISFMWFLGTHRVGVQTIMVAGVGALVGFNLLLIVVLDYPFAGEVSVSHHVFHEGSLEELVGPPR